MPERRPSAEQLLTCSKLETEVKSYLAYVSSLKEQTASAERTRIASQGGGQVGLVNSQVTSVGCRDRVGSQGSADGGYGTGSLENEQQQE